MTANDTLARAKQGDRAAVEALLRGELDRIRAVLFRYLGGGPELDDVTQKVLLEIVAGLPSFRGESALSTWVHTICVRCAWAHRRVRSNLVFLDTVPDSVDPAAGAEQLEARDLLRVAQAALARIEPERRIVFVLHDVEGYGAPEIARTLSIPEGTVHSRLREARSAVRAFLRRADGRGGAAKGGVT